MNTPLIAPPEAQPHTSARQSEMRHSDRPAKENRATERLSRPFRLGLVGLGAAVGLFVRLLAANGFGDLDSRSTMAGAAVTSGLMGLGLLLIASERDRFGPPLAWISAITALAWGALNWISPPFASSVTVWSQPDQSVLAVLGLGNGLLLAGILALAFVRRHPTFAVGATLVASVFALAANTVVLRDEWAAIISLGIAFALILLAWDRSPRRELAFARPEASPRVSRAALSFISVALCGTALQLWTSRTDIPRSIPAVIICVLLVIGAFVTLVGVRREIENRETTLSEWTSWAREVRTNDFRAEMQNFESDTAGSANHGQRAAGVDGEPPRKLSFPNLSIPDTEPTPTASITPHAASTPTPAADAVTPPDLVPTMGLQLTPDVGSAAPRSDSIPDTVIPDTVVPDTVVPDTGVPDVAVLPRIDASATPTAPVVTEAALESPQPDAASGAFSTVLATDAEVHGDTVELATLAVLGAWLSSPVATARTKPLLVAIEAMSLDEFESLPPIDAAMATDEIGSFLADTMPDADLVAWIDGPYFIVAFASKPDNDLSALNKSVRKSLKGTNGMVAFLRPGPSARLDDIVDEAVMGLLHARRAEDRAAGR